MYVGTCTLLIPHVKRMRHLVICDLSGSTTFFTLAYKQHNIFNTKRFLFPLQILYEIFLTLRKIQQDIVINSKMSSCKVTVILVRF